MEEKHQDKQHQDKQLPKILEEVKRHGFVVFTSGEFNLNIIAVRNREKVPNVFNDKIYLCYKRDGAWQEHEFTCTTDPSTYWLNTPMRKDGTAVLMHPQQMRAAFELGYHKNTYKCLRQVRQVKVWRDNNKDNIIDYGNMTNSRSWGIQIHRANSKYRSLRVGKYSAGCIVLNDPFEYAKFINIIETSLQINPTWRRFSVTLIEG